MPRDIVAALDVGSTKVCCFIAERRNNGEYRVLGIGDLQSRGILEGAVVDIRSARQAIAMAVSKAEQEARVKVQQIHVATSGGRPASQRVHVELAAAGARIALADIRAAQEAAFARIEISGRRLLLLRPLGYSVDGVGGIDNPLGMYGRRIAIDLHAVTAEPGPLANLHACGRAAHVEVAEILPSTYAAGLALLSEEDRELGIAVVDMGGGTTGIAVFGSRGATFVDVLQKGGVRLTEDIAYAFSLSFREAEAIKVKDASCLSGSPSGVDPLPAPVLDGNFGKESLKPAHPPYLRQIVTPRTEQTFERIRARLDETYAGREAGRRVILTGGASQLVGAARLGEIILGRQVQIGALGPSFHVTDSRAGAAYAGCAGLLVHAASGQAAVSLPASDMAPSHLLGRLGAWVRQQI